MTAPICMYETSQLFPLKCGFCRTKFTQDMVTDTVRIAYEGALIKGIGKGIEQAGDQISSES